MWYIYTMEYSSAMKKNGILSLATSWTQPDYHTKWSQKERQTPYDITFTWKLKYDTKELIYKTETDSHWKQTYGYQRGRGWGGIN